MRLCFVPKQIAAQMLFSRDLDILTLWVSQEVAILGTNAAVAITYSCFHDGSGEGESYSDFAAVA
jgi:hypothetical protein